MGLARYGKGRVGTVLEDESDEGCKMSRIEQPIERRTAAASQRRTLDRATLPGQVVLVLQGGGALGSYQAGVYQALQDAGVEPDWIVGTSIGAINASLIAGNAPEDRLARLAEF